MDRVYKSGGVAGAPDAAENASGPFPTAGNPEGGQPATKPGPFWFHMITESLAQCIEGAGLALDKTALTRFKEAVIILGGQGVASSIPNGLGTSNNAVDPDHDIDIAPGVEVDDTGVDFLKIAATLTKRIDGSWAVGTNQGGLDGTESLAGTPDADAWFYLWLIKRSDTGVVDAIFSRLSTSPNMPTNYDRKVLISAHRTDGLANIKPYYQDKGWFKWRAGVAVISAGTAGADTAVTLTPAVPPIAKSFSAWAHVKQDAGGAGTNTADLVVQVAASVDYATLVKTQWRSSTTESDIRSGGDFEIPNTGTFNYRLVVAVSSGSATINITGFKLSR